MPSLPLSLEFLKLPEELPDPLTYGCVPMEGPAGRVRGVMRGPHFNWPLASGALTCTRVRVVKGQES